MASKNNIDLSGFDFGFSIVDEDELSAVTSVKAEVEAATDTSKAWKAQADEWQAKTNAIYDAIIPLLNNLQANEDKEYIYVTGGILEVQPHVVTILADSATRSDELDEEAALEAKNQAEQALQGADKKEDLEQAQAQLAEAAARYSAVKKLKGKKRSKKKNFFVTIPKNVITKPANNIHQYLSFITVNLLFFVLILS